MSPPPESNALKRPFLFKPITRDLSIGFNREKIKGFYNIIDARSSSERAADKERGHLAGSAIVFLTGHAQRPADACKFSNDLARRSRSGIVIVPVCDTPYGKDPEWHGDRGKDVVLMEMVRHLLLRQTIFVEGVKPLTDMQVTINGNLPAARGKGINTGLAVVGWSHGGLLARRMTSAYPDAVNGIGQVCPAGYAKLRHGSLSLLTNFLSEPFRVTAKLLSKQAPDVIGSGFGVLKGLTGDAVRGVGSAVMDAEPARMLRSVKDIRDAGLYCDDASLPLKGIEYIIVIFAQNDSVIDPLQTGIKDPTDPSEEDIRNFWERFYPGLLQQDIVRTLRFLKGDHIAPISFHDLYATVVLEGMGQLRGYNSIN